MSYSFSLDGKVAIITGSSRGIGKAIALGFGALGASVVLASRNISDLKKVHSELSNQYDAKSAYFQTNVANINDVHKLIDTTLKKFKSIDILVNNAGISPVVTKAENLSKKDWDEILSTNLTGSFICAQEAGKVMIEQKSGCIINIASICSVRALFGLVAYSISKAGIMEMTKVLALEWAKYNIRVNAIGPGYIETEINRKLRESKGKIYQNAIDKIPMKRFGKVDEIVGAAIFLASDEASYITGHTLFVDGGWLTQ